MTKVLSKVKAQKALSRLFWFCDSQSLIRMSVKRIKNSPMCEAERSPLEKSVTQDVRFRLSEKINRFSEVMRKKRLIFLESDVPTSKPITSERRSLLRAVPNH